MFEDEIPAIADHALAILDRLQKKPSYYDPSKVEDLSRRCLKLETFSINGKQIKPPRGYDLMPQADFERWIIEQEKRVAEEEGVAKLELSKCEDDDWTGLQW